MIKSDSIINILIYEMLMVEPISLTVLATSIVGFVFTTASTTVVEKATETTLKKINT